MTYNKKMKKASTNYNFNFDNKWICSLSDFEKILNSSEGIDEEIEEEIIDIIELLKYAVEEINDLMLLGMEQDKAVNQIQAWQSSCTSEYYMNMSTLACDKITEQYHSYNEEVESLIEETMLLVEQSLENIIKVKSIFKQKVDKHNDIKDNCYLKLDDGNCGCGKGYARNY